MSTLKTPPTLEFIYELLEDQLPSLPEEPRPNNKPSSKPPSKPTLTPPPKVRTPIYRAEGGRSHCCSACRGHSHPLFVCNVFRGWTQAQRNEHVKNSRLCYNCLSHSHGTRDCTSTHFCRTCGGRHHTLLHRPSVPAPPPPSTTARDSNGFTESRAGVARVHQPLPTSLLSTALIKASHGRDLKVVRAMMDTGAAVSLITARVNVSQVQDLARNWLACITDSASIMTT